MEVEKEEEEERVEIQMWEGVGESGYICVIGRRLYGEEGSTEVSLSPSLFLSPSLSSHTSDSATCIVSFLNTSHPLL